MPHNIDELLSALVSGGGLDLRVGAEQPLGTDQGQIERVNSAISVQVARKVLDRILSELPPCSAGYARWHGRHDRAAADQWRTILVRQLLQLKNSQ